MQISGAWLFKSIPKDAPGLQYGVALVPSPRRDRGFHASFSGGEVLVGFKAAKQPEGALELARYLVRPENAQALAAAAMSVQPATVGADTSAYYRERPREQLMIRQFETAVPTPNHPEWVDMEAAIEDEVEQALYHKKTPAKAIADAQARLASWWRSTSDGGVPPKQGRPRDVMALPLAVGDRLRPVRPLSVRVLARGLVHRLLADPRRRVAFRRRRELRTGARRSGVLVGARQHRTLRGRHDSVHHRAGTGAGARGAAGLPRAHHVSRWLLRAERGFGGRALADLQGLYAPDGGLNGLLRWLGLPTPAWLLDAHTALPAIMAMDVWSASGYYMIIFLAGLEAIPRELYDAARLEGASWWDMFTRITLPLLRPTLLFVLVVNTVRSLQIFAEVFVMTRGGPLHATTTVVYYLYEQAFYRFDLGYASAVAYLLFAVTLVLAWLQMKTIRAREAR
jgi:hypothetical protein